MNRSPLTRVAQIVVVFALLLIDTAGRAAPYVEMDPKKLTAEQNELLDYAYLTQRLDLLPQLKATGDQVVVVRHARQSINSIQTLSRSKTGEAELQGGRGAGPGMVKIVLEKLVPVRDALSEEQRVAFKKLMVDQDLQPFTVDATAGHFLFRYTFGPNDNVEKAKAKDGRVIDVVVPEKEEGKTWMDELTNGAELIRLLENKVVEVHKPAGDWLIRHGGGKLDAKTKETIAELILQKVEGGAGAAGQWMQAYSQVGQPAHEKRVFALLEKCIIHDVAGMTAAYASVAPAQALDYAAKPRTDKNYPIRAVQGLGMAPDGLRLLQAARAKMPDMKWMIDQQVKAVTELQKARAEGRPGDPGEAATIAARKKAQREAEERAKSGKKPGDYQGFDDWFADLSGGDRNTVRKAAYHFANSVHAVDLSQATPAQRAAVFKIAHAAWNRKTHPLNEGEAGPLLIAAAGPDDTETLLGMITPETRAHQFPLAALIRANPGRAEQVILGIIDGRPKFRLNPIDDAARLVPAAAIPVIHGALPKIKHPDVRTMYEKIIVELKEQLEKVK